jgi:AraC-like DNA-binding protein
MKELLETTFLLAAIQGILLSAALLRRKNNHKANILLTVGIIALSMELISVVYYSREWFRIFPGYMGITYPFAWLYGPVFYLYVVILTKKKESLSKMETIHFLPAILVYFSIAPVFFYSAEMKIQFVEKMIANNQALIYTLIESLIPIQGIIYSAFTIAAVINYNNKIKESFSNIEKINLNWLRHLAVGIITIWVLAAGSMYLRLFTGGDIGSNFLLHFAISVLIYSVGYMGLNQPEIFMRNEVRTNEEQQLEKYKKSGLDEESAERIKKELIGLMEKEKPYLDSELTLNKLAELLGVSNHHLSEVINSKLNKSYYDFINEYRVEEFKQRVHNPSNSNFNIIAIAMDSGFNSKTSFNTLFKKMTGQTPSQFRNSAVLQKESTKEK